MSAYEFEISRADRVIDLAALREQVRQDDTLDSVEKEELIAAAQIKIVAILTKNRTKRR